MKFDVAIVGAGAAGLIAALRAFERGLSVVVLERDAVPMGSTSLSAGLIPAANTRFQREKNIADSAALFSNDISKKAHNEADKHLVLQMAETSSKVIEWLADTYHLPFSVVDNFDYPGHSARRMHGLPTRSGLELINALREQVEKCDIPLLTSTKVLRLITENNRVIGIETKHEKIMANAVILASNGYGGNKSLVDAHITEMQGALYFGHAGNEGDAVLWGQELGAKLKDLSGYQGHGSVAHPHSILISWATMSEGGFQVNLEGNRFHDESKGYSEAACEVLKQPNGLAYSVFDDKIAKIARQFEDFKQAEKQNAFIIADTLEELALKLKMPVQSLENAHKQRGERLKAPFYAVKVTGALFHTQGGLVVNDKAQVLRQNESVITGLYAVGGAACGVSGAQASGYLSGNGLLTAVSLGYIAGDNA